MIQQPVQRKKRTYFISFVEEGILNPDYKEYVGGRVEIYDDINSFEVDEIRFFTNKKSWNSFRNKWDFREVTKKQLDSLRKTIKEKYYEPKW